MRYILFGGEEYYPYGGADDIIGFGSSVDTLAASEINKTLDWWHIYDTRELEIVLKRGCFGDANSIDQ
jgi:hypothetical protein